MRKVKVDLVKRSDHARWWGSPKQSQLSAGLAAPSLRPVKEQVAIRLDPDVLGAFRAGGPGWQTRMNAALKEWLAAHPVKTKARAKSAT